MPLGRCERCGKSHDMGCRMEDEIVFRKKKSGIAVSHRTRHANPKPAESILVTREQLKSVEFIWDNEDGQSYCPKCGVRRGLQHTETCWLGAALGEKR